jgi:hypothetical protein
MKNTVFLIVLLLLLSIHSHAQSVKRKVHPVGYDDIPYAYRWIDKFRFFGMKQKLYKDTISDEEYRFLCMPNAHHEFIISIQKKANTYSISWSKSNAVWDTDSKKAKADPIQSKEISENEWLEFVKRVDDMRFWQMAQANGDEEHDTTTQDAWLFEGKDNKRYHIICWWEPMPHSKNLYSCLKYLLELTGVKVKLIKPY